MEGVLVAVGGKILDLALWLLRKLWRTTQHPSPETVVARNLVMRSEIATNLPPVPQGNSSRGRALLRDIKRQDRYRPDQETSYGGSGWSVVEIKDLYFNGLEVYDAPWKYVEYSEVFERWQEVATPTTTSIMAIIVGRIPFSNIVRINWEGDEFYAYPHIYCRFNGVTHTPYEEIVLYKQMSDDDPDYLMQVTGTNQWNRPLGRVGRFKRQLRVRMRSLMTSSCDQLVTNEHHKDKEPPSDQPKH